MFSVEQSMALFGLFAVSVPVILHLLPRLKPDLVVFPSLKFFRLNLFRLRRRIMLYNLLRLIARIMFLCCIVTAIAGPYIAEKTKNQEAGLPESPLVSLASHPEQPVAGIPSRIAFQLKDGHEGVKIFFSSSDENTEIFAYPGQQNATLSHVFRTSGENQARVVTEQGMVRHSYSVAVPVIEPRNILVISSDNDTPLSAFFQSLGKTIGVSSFGTTDIIERVPLKSYDLLVILNAGHITMKHYRHLEKFMEQGGQVFMFLPDDLHPDYLNKLFHNYNENYHGFLPGKLESMSTESERISKADFSEFLSEREDLMKRISINTLFRIKLDEDAVSLVSTGTGKSIIASKPFGKGRCVTFLFPLKKEATDLWETRLMTPFFADLILSGDSIDLELKETEATRKSVLTEPDRKDLTIIFIYLSLVFLLLEGLLARPSQSGDLRKGFISRTDGANL